MTSTRSAARSAASESRRKLLRYWIIDPLDALWKVPLHHLMRWLPIGFSSAVGARLGRLIVPWIYPGWDARARRNLLHLEPHLSPQQLRQAMRLMWGNLGRTYAEFSALDRIWPSGRIQVEGAEHVLAAQRAGRPCIVAAVHLGNWELTALAFVRLGLQGCAVCQPMGTRFEWQVVSAARDRYMAGRIALYPPGRASGRAVYNTVMRRRQGLHMHVDEWLGGRINAPSFGRPLSFGGNLATVVRLALAADAVLVPCYGERLGESARFRLTIEPPLALERSGDRDADLRVNIEQLDRRLEAIVRPRLSQWMMLREPIFE
jgi:Kdo2-lipid IVA lauroyltransferase/acyltransferase